MHIDSVGGDKTLSFSFSLSLSQTRRQVLAENQALLRAHRQVPVLLGVQLHIKVGSFDRVDWCRVRTRRWCCVKALVGPAPFARVVLSKERAQIPSQIEVSGGKPHLEVRTRSCRRYYYKKRGDTVPKGLIFLGGCTCTADAAASTSSSWAFTITHLDACAEGVRPATLFAASSQESATRRIQSDRDHHPRSFKNSS